MRVKFYVPEDKRPGILAEAEIEFGRSGDLGHMAGLKLVGFTVREGEDETMYVTLPARAFGAGSTRAYFNFIRNESPDPSAQEIEWLKSWILDEFENWEESNTLASATSEVAKAT